MTIIDCRPFLAVGVSFFAAILIAFSRKWPNVREAWSAIASVIMFGIILSMVPGVLDGNQYEWTLCRITDTLAGLHALGTDELLLHRLHAMQQ